MVGPTIRNRPPERTPVVTLRVLILTKNGNLSGVHFEIPVVDSSIRDINHI